ncbi:TPA: hypothetical protein SAU40_000880 [Campylobacter jejuni]|nr:hypothetical protein [Campylobacter jejuni]
MNSKTKLIHCGRGDQGAEVRSVNPTLMRDQPYFLKITQLGKNTEN